ncbi:MAG: 3-deoxy-D-manno-octulosonic acid kinase [Burkholderiaceae bacterium]
MGRRALALIRPSPMHRAYRLLLRLLTLPLLAWLWWRGRREPGYRQRLAERLGWVDPAPSSMDGILIQAASVGEIQAARPLIQALQASWPLHALTVTTQTPTGAATLREHWGDAVQHLYAPLDTPGACARLLDRLQPRLLVLVERELWPEMMLQCRQRDIPVFLVNARLSERSARGYRRWPSLMQPVWSQLALVCAADAPTYARLQQLGVAAERMQETGNLKFDTPPPPIGDSEPVLPAGHPVIVAGSTHEQEEAQLLDAWPAFAQRHPQAMLVLVPRHPQRFDAVANTLTQRGIAHARRSRAEWPDETRRVLLGDTMGELTSWYRQATVCFIGGTLQPVGGHNALEAMAEGKPVLFGPHTRNFETLYTQIREAGAGRQVRSGAELFDTVDHWLAEDAAMKDTGRRALAYVLSQRGAVERTLAAWPLHLPTAYLDQAPEPVIRHAEQGQVAWYAREDLAGRGPAVFESGPEAGEPLATGSGRGQALRLTLGPADGVLRHYRRGGLIARFNPDRYWGWRAAESRAMAEYALLRWMRARGLPVPRPLAARRCGKGPRYTADILVEWIPGSRNLAQHLDSGDVAEADWIRLGEAIRRMHDLQVFHSDLNCHNLLLDSNRQAWIIDFDKCDRRSGHDWKAANLERLRRSLRKEAGRRPGFHWKESAWDGLILGYGRTAPQAPRSP